MRDWLKITKMFGAFLFWQPAQFGFNPILFFFSHFFLWLLIFGVTFWLAFKKKYRLLFLFWVVLLASEVVEILIKHFSPWARPFYTNNASPPEWFAGYSLGSFPSGHGMRSAILLYFFWIKNRKLFWLILPGLLLTNIGRVLFGLHYPVDIIGGFLLGFLLVKIGFGLKSFSGFSNDL